MINTETDWSLLRIHWQWLQSLFLADGAWNTTEHQVWNERRSKYLDVFNFGCILSFPDDHLPGFVVATTWQCTSLPCDDRAMGHLKLFFEEVVGPWVNMTQLESTIGSAAKKCWIVVGYGAIEPFVSLDTINGQLKSLYWHSKCLIPASGERGERGGGG